MTWKEYDFNEQCVADRLPWEAIVLPTTVYGKDDSFLGIIEYKAYARDMGKRISLPWEFSCGWSLWSETQQFDGKKRHFLAVVWNPFTDEAGHLLNYPIFGFLPASRKELFQDILHDLVHAMSAVTECQILEYQEIFDFLDFTLSFGLQHTPMPDPPIDLDALLSQDLSISFAANGVEIEGKEIVIASFPAVLDYMDSMTGNAFHNLTYRYVRRLLLFDREESEHELSRYTSRWCGGRTSIKKLVCQDILGTLNGYYREMFLFLVEKEHRDAFIEGLRDFTYFAKLPCVLEGYNLKDIWWGSLPGLFRSDITPPIVGFSSLEDILTHRAEKEADDVSNGHFPAASLASSR